jgi:protease I
MSFFLFKTVWERIFLKIVFKGKSIFCNILKTEKSIMAESLKGKKIAILATDGVEQIELTEPKEALEKAGAETEIISLKSGKIQGFNHLDPADKFNVDKKVSEAKAADYDGLLLPGGVANPDALRQDKDAVGFVSAFFKSEKPVAAICHAPWTLIEAGVAQGRTLTSFGSIQNDLKNAGANWVDKEVVVDGNLVTSRKPDDIPAFNKAMIEKFSQ